MFIPHSNTWRTCSKVAGHQHCCNHHVKPGSSSHSLLLGHGPPLLWEHFPIPSLLPCRAAAGPCTFLLRERSRAAPPLLAASILLPPWHNVRAAPAPAPRAGSPGTGCLGQAAGKPQAGGVQEHRKVSKHRFAAQLLTQSKLGWGGALKSGKDFPFLHHHAQPTPSSSNDLPKEFNTIQRLALPRHLLFVAACEAFKYQQ